MDEIAELIEYLKGNKGTTAFVCLAVAALVLFAFPGKTKQASNALSGRSAAAAPAALVAAAMDSNQFDDNSDTQTLNIRVLNRGQSSLSGLHLEVLAPGFELGKLDMQSCGRFDKATGTSLLDAGQLCTVAVPLRAIAWSGDYQVAVKSGWFQGQPESTVLNVGTVHMHGFLGRETWLRFGARLAQVFKDLTLPLLLLLVTTRLSSWQKDREIRQAEQDRKRTELAQVRQLLLDKIREMAESYYLKISSAGKGILDARSDLDSGKQTSTDRMFYNAMLLVWHMTALKDERGGLFFQNRLAEEIVSKAWSILKPTLFAVVGEDQIATALSLLAKDASFVTFKKSIRFIAAGSMRFTHWYAGDEAAILQQHGKLDAFVPVIDALQAIFLYETNVPFDEYYQESRPLRYHSDPFHTPPEAQLNEAQKRAAAGLVESFTPYLEKNRLARRYPN